MPAEALVTFTVTVQLPEAGIVAPESATEAALFAAVTLPPAQVVAPLAEAVLTRPAGYVSVNAAPLIGVAFGLVSVIVRTEAPPGTTSEGENAFAIVGCKSTVKVADAPAAVPAFVVVTLPVELA